MEAPFFFRNIETRESMYSFDSRVRYSELAENGRLSLDGIVNYLQDCTCFESEELGVGMETTYSRERMWVLNF